MKSLRLALVFIVVLVCLFGLTGCTTSSDPTLAEIKVALGEAGYILGYDNTTMESVVSGYSYKITIENTKKSGKNATVTAVFDEVYGVCGLSRKFEINFKSNYSGSGWKAGSVTQLGDSTPSLKGHINMRKAKILFLETEGVNVGGLYNILEDNVIAFKPDEDTINESGMTETIHFTCTADEGINVLTYYATVNYEYTMGATIESGEWAVESYIISDEFSLETSPDYSIDNIDEKALANYFETKLKKVIILGDTYNGTDENVQCDNVHVQDIELTGQEYIQVPVTFDFIVGENDLVATFDGKCEFLYTGGRFEPYYIGDLVLKKVTGSFVGAWNGTFNDGKDTASVKITDECDEFGNPLVTIVVVSSDPELNNYSWTAILRNYEPNNGYYQRIMFKEWITLPTNENEYAYRDFSGKITDGKWVSEFTWDSFTFTNG